MIFIFSTTEFSKIIPTIQSRCQKHHFFLLNENTITDQIIKVTALEKGAIDHLAAVKIAKLAQGSLRDALSLLGQIMIYANNKITLKDVENVLLLADQNSQISFLKALFTNNIEQVVTILQTVYFQGFKLEQFLTDLIAIIIDLLVYYHSHKVQLLQTIQLSQINDLSPIPTNLKQYLLHLETTINELKKGQNPLLITKLGVMKIIHLSSDQY